MKKVLIINLIVLILIGTISFASVNTNTYKNISADNTFKTVGSPIIGVVQLIAGLTAVATLGILGIRFMLASPDGRAEIKSQLAVYLVGAALSAAMVPILGILYNIFKT